MTNTYGLEVFVDTAKFISVCFGAFALVALLFALKNHSVKSWLRNISIILAMIVAVMAFIYCLIVYESATLMVIGAVVVIALLWVAYGMISLIHDK